MSPSQIPSSGSPPWAPPTLPVLPLTPGPQVSPLPHSSLLPRTPNTMEEWGGGITRLHTPRDSQEQQREDGLLPPSFRHRQRGWGQGQGPGQSQFQPGLRGLQELREGCRGWEQEAGMDNSVLCFSLLAGTPAHSTAQKGWAKPFSEV